MAIRLNISIKLYFLLAVMSVVILIAGTYGISRLETLNQITGTMYADRLVPIQQLSTVRSFYEPSLLSIPSRVNNHQLSYEQAERQLEKSEEKSNILWQAYQQTYMTPKEAELIKESNALMYKARPSLAKLKGILKTKDAAAVDNFIMKDYYESIEPIASKMNQLIELQVRVSEEKFRMSGEIYRKTQRNSYLFLVLSLSTCILLGLFVIKNVRFLVKNLQMNNDKITQSENKFREFIKHAGDSILIIDSTYQINEVNDSACKLLNYSGEELQNMRMYELMTTGDQQSFAARAKIIDATGGSLFERTFVRKDGSLVDTEMNVRPLQGGGYIAIIRDIAERKLAEATIKEREAQLTAFFENIEGAAALLDAEKKYLLFNKRFIYDHHILTNQDPYVGEVVYDLFPEEIRKERLKLLDNVLKGSKEAVEVDYVRDGKRVYYRTSFNPVIRDGKVTGISTFSIDLTESKEAEIAIKEQSEIFSAIIENVNESIWLLSPDLKVLQFNKTAKERLLLNRGKEIYLGANFKEFLHIGTDNVFMPMFNDALAGKYPELETSQTNIQGDVFWLRSRMYPVYDTQKALIGVTVLTENITERKKVERELEKSEEKNRALVENITDAIVLLDANSQVVYQSPSVERINGYSFGDRNTNGQTYEFVYKEDQSKVIEIVQRSLREPGVPISYQVRLNHKEGRIIWIEATILNLLHNESVKAFVVSYHDVTDRKNAQRALEQSEERNRSLIENISDTIILINDKWEVVYQSPSYIRTAGFTLEEQKGKTALDIIYPDDVQHGREIIEKSKASPGAAMPFQLRTLHKQGNYIWIEGTITNLLQNDSVKAFVLNYRDVTSRKILESERLKIIDEMLQRNRDLEQFAYIVSHNLRAPVANIIGITDYLKHEDIDQDEKDQMTEGLRVSVHALDAVIKDLNSILQTKREISEKKEVVRFSKILDDVKLSIATLINDEKVVINSDFSEIDEMLTLKSYLHSIFYNLISNSIKYRQPEIPPAIEIRSELHGNSIEITFKDNGMGIDLEKKGRQVFGLYKRFHTHVEGKGMGLYMVKTQVETLGGKISIKSKINEGTEFKIKFEIEKNIN